jgi:hypothetical protein
LAAADSFSMIADGVPVRASSPIQIPASKLAIPASVSVETSGMIEARFDSATAHAFHYPMQETPIRFASSLGAFIAKSGQCAAVEKSVQENP